MSNTLPYLGIYPSAIEEAVDLCERAMEDLGFSLYEIDGMNEKAAESFYSGGDIRDITNAIISAYFETTECVIKDAHPQADVNYVVDGDASYFCATI